MAPPSAVSAGEEEWEPWNGTDCRAAVGLAQLASTTERGGGLGGGERALKVSRQRRNQVEVLVGEWMRKDEPVGVEELTPEPEITLDPIDGIPTYR